MRELVKEAFGMNLRIMRALGFYSPQNYTKFYKIYTYTVYCFFTVLVPILASLYLLLGEDVDLAQVSDNAFLLCQSGCYIVKMIPFVHKGDDFKKSIFMLECPIFMGYTKKQEKIIEECIRTCKIISRLFLGLCTATFVSWTIAPLLVNEKHKLPIEIWLPFDGKSGAKSYFLSFAFVVAGVGNGAFANAALDPLIAGLACQATTQLKILKNNLQNLNEYAEEEVSKITRSQFDSSEKECYKSRIIYGKIKLCVEHHRAILGFVENYQNTYSLVAFTQFMASVVVICISCLQLSMVEPFTFTFFSMILYLITMLSEIFLYCYYGTTLFEESNTLTDAIYMGQWYEYDIKSRKALITLMERSKRPMTVTAGKILDLSLVTFTTILRRAYSLLAVLKNY